MHSMVLSSTRMLRAFQPPRNFRMVFLSSFSPRPPSSRRAPAFMCIKSASFAVSFLGGACIFSQCVQDSAPLLPPSQKLLLLRALLLNMSLLPSVWFVIFLEDFLLITGFEQFHGLPFDVATFSLCVMSTEFIDFGKFEKNLNVTFFEHFKKKSVSLFHSL